MFNIRVFCEAFSDDVSWVMQAVTAQQFIEFLKILA